MEISSALPIMPPNGASSAANLADAPAWQNSMANAQDAAAQTESTQSAGASSQNSSGSAAFEPVAPDKLQQNAAGQSSSKQNPSVAKEQSTSDNRQAATNQAETSSSDAGQSDGISAAPDKPDQIPAAGDVTPVKGDGKKGHSSQTETANNEAVDEKKKDDHQLSAPAILEAGQADSSNPTNAKFQQDGTEKLVDVAGASNAAVQGAGGNATRAPGAESGNAANGNTAKASEAGPQSSARISTNSDSTLSTGNTPSSAPEITVSAGSSNARSAAADVTAPAPKTAGPLPSAAPSTTQLLAARAPQPMALQIAGLDKDGKDDTLPTASPSEAQSFTGSAVIGNSAQSAASSYAKADTAAQANALTVTSTAPSALAATITALHQSGQANAVLRLDPPGLGHLSVQIGLGGQGQVNVLFVPSTADAAQALQATLPSLGNALAQSGLTLGQAQVGGQGFQQNSQNGQGGQQRSYTPAMARDNSVSSKGGTDSITGLSAYA